MDPGQTELTPAAGPALRLLGRLRARPPAGALATRGPPAANDPPRTRHSLAQLLLRRALLAYVIFALVITGIQMYVEYRVVRDQVMDDLGSLARAFSPGVEAAVWDMDQAQLHSIVTGIGANSAVVRVQIRDPDGAPIGTDWLSSSGLEASQALAVQQPLYFANDRGRQLLGTLRIASSDAILFERIESTLWSVAASDGALFLCLGLLLWLLMRSLVVRPLVSFSDQVAALSTTGHGAPLDLEGFELGEIATLKLGFNRLMQQLASSHLRIADQNAQLQYDKAKLRCIIDSIPDLIFIKDRDSVFLGCNKAFEHFAGRRESEIIGRTDFEILDASLARVVRDQDRELISTGAPSIYERAITYPDGRRAHVETVKTLFFGPDGELLGLVGVARDISERKALEEEHRIAALVYENTSEAIILLDERGRIMAINPAFTGLSGYGQDEVLGASARLLVSPRQDPSIFRAVQRALENDGRWRGEVWNRNKAGHDFIVEVTMDTIYADDGRVHRRVALLSDVTEKRQAENLIWSQANYDHLTGLPNRRLFQDRLSQEIKKARRDSGRLAVLFIDLDRFKEINDTLGHELGDLLLIEAADRIRTRLRETDTLSRFGGDEFTIVLPNASDDAGIGRVSTDIIDRLSEPYFIEGQESFVSASIGVALYPDDAEDVTDLIRHADQAMYAANAGGRGRFNFFTRALQEASELRTRVAIDLRRALREGQLELHYQPIVDLATGQVRKAEALLRWQHPVLGYVNPVTFIPIAEETGTIQEIGDWVFHQAVAQVRRWRAQFDPNMQVGVNMSPVQFLRDTRAHRHWVEHLTQIGMPGESVVIEITEGLLMSTEPIVSETLLAFRDAGIQVAIDDFGTGYSALSYLKKFHIDFLKIDRTFTNNLAPKSPDFALCEAIVVMAHKLDVKVVAEGVESAQQRALLAQIGCDFAQGYLFARPMELEAFEQLLSAPARRLAGPGT